MISETFSATAERTSAAGIVRMAGTITRAAATELATAFEDACATGSAKVALDFSAVSYLNSTGIALIVGVLAEAREAGLEVVAWGLSDHFREIFEITRLVEYVHLHENELTALGTP